MINLKNIQRYSRQIVSNPIKAVRKVFGNVSAAKSLESSPAVDTLIKVNPQNYILGSQPGKLIKELVKNKSDAFGKDAMVFPIPNYHDLVLRVEHTAIEKIDDLADSLKLIPIKHDDKILAHKNLGLPLYSVVGKESELYTKESVSPLEALKQKDNIMVLRRVLGENPANASWNALQVLHGLPKLSGEQAFSNNLDQFAQIVSKYKMDGLKKCLQVLKNGGEQNIPRNFFAPGSEAYTFTNSDMFVQNFNFRQLTEIRREYGLDAAKQCFQIIKQGGDQTIPENFFADNTGSYIFTNCDEFVKNYKTYSKSYINYLKQLSKMPKESFKEAVDTILMDKNFLVDFQHTGNTFVDFKNKKFNFMDFEFDKTNQKYIYDNPVREFKNVILGKGFSTVAKYPTAILLEEKYTKTALKYFDKISNMINSVTPDKYKF